MATKLFEAIARSRLADFPNQTDRMIGGIIGVLRFQALGTPLPSGSPWAGPTLP
jgi:hypothetical protein